MTDVRIGTTRSRLAQRRSRDTRQTIIRAALQIWSERGYATAFDDIRTDDIVSRAGVAKATFYLHFARKDDILLETGWLTAEVLYEDALEALQAGGEVADILAGLLVTLCRRVENVPRAALRRMLEVMLAQSEAARARPVGADHFGFRRAFTVILARAQQTGDVSAAVSATRLGVMLESLIFAAICEWAFEEASDLLPRLREPTAVLLAGARVVTEQDLRGLAT